MSPRGEQGGDSMLFEEQAGSTDLADLVAAAQSGDLGAADQLFRRVGAAVKATARLLIGRRLRLYLDSDDVVQEALASALVSLPRFRYHDDAGLLQWLASVTAHRVGNLATWHHRQKRDRRREVSLGVPVGDDTDGHPGWPGDGSSPSHHAAREETGRIIRECLLELSPDHRDVLVLVEYLGSSMESAAARLERSVGATRMLHRRATLALGRRLRRRGVLDAPDR